MPTPSGTITLDNVQTEFGGTNPIGINEYYAGGTYVSSFVSGVPTSSTIDMNSLRNKTKISISNDKSSVNEGDSVTFTVTTATVTNGTVFYWAAISGTGATAGDIVGDSPLGSITINSNTATVSLTVKLDSDTPETGESFAIRFYYTQADRDAFTNHFAQSNTVAINNATYSIAPAVSNVNEGGSLTINVTTTNITNGTTFYWTINHTTTTTSDFSSNSGSFTITTNSGSFTVGPVADQVTEGAESFTVSMRPYSTSGVVLATTSSITVNDTSITPPTATATLSASPSSITNGTSSTLSWTTTNATSASINQGIGSVSVGSGSTTVSPTTTTTYTITPYNSVGTAGTTASTTVTVYPAASSTLSASPGNITSGGSSTLSWTMTNSSIVFGGVINPGNISVSGSSGTVSVSPTSTTTYTITPYNAINVAGSTASATVTVYPVASSTLSASPSSIYTGNSSTLSWTMSNASGGGLISPGNINVSGTSGTVSVSPSSTTTYTITPYNALNSPGNTASATVTVTTPPTYYSVPQINSITWSPASVDEGNGITFTLSVTDNAYSGAPRNFYYASIGGAGTDAADFSGVGYGTLTSIDGTTTRTFTVYFSADQMTEGTETFSIGIYSAGPYQGSPYYQTNYININDTSTTPSLTLTSIGFSPNPAYNGQGYTITVNQSGTSGSNNNITLILDQKAPNNFYGSFGPASGNQLITINAGSTSGSFSSTITGASLRHNAQLTASGSITSGGSVNTWAILGGNSSYMSYISFNVTNTNSAQQNTVDTVVYLRNGQTLHFGTNNGTALSGTSYTGDTYIRLFSQSTGLQVSPSANVGESDDNGGGYGSYLTWTNNLGDGNYILKIGAWSSGSASGTAAYYFS